MVAFELTPGQRGDIRPAPGLVTSLPPAMTLLADAAYDSDAFRQLLIERGTTPVIKQNPTRKRLHPFDKNAYKGRNIIERAFSRLKDWRRVATRYDKLARNFRSTIALVSMVTWWI
jgi:transposase